MSVSCKPGVVAFKRHVVAFKRGIVVIKRGVVAFTDKGRGRQTGRQAREREREIIVRLV